MKVIFQIAGCVACLSLVVLQGGAANAQTSVEQAWSQCLKAADAAAGPKEADGSNDAARVAAFKACMTKMGHPAGK